MIKRKFAETRYISNISLYIRSLYWTIQIKILSIEQIPFGMIKSQTIIYIEYGFNLV